MENQVQTVKKAAKLLETPKKKLIIVKTKMMIQKKTEKTITENV